MPLILHHLLKWDYQSNKRDLAEEIEDMAGSRKDALESKIMQVRETKISGCYELTPKVYADVRNLGKDL